MLKALYNALFYKPLYNGLIFLLAVLPWGDAGIAVILFTCIVKLILFPLSRKAVETQLKMKQFEPEIESLKAKFKDDKQVQAVKLMEFYREKKVNPFSSFFVILIQIPIIFGLYFVFYKGGLPVVNESLLYSFTPMPANINMEFLGLIDITNKSWILAILAGVSSFFQMKFSVPPIKKKTGTSSFGDDLARSMNFQMRYFMPIVVLFIAYSISGVIALYWTTSNLFTIGQELVIRKRMKPRNGTGN
ncbi:MAG: YidC/Oxa1 family membrane protein insertase [bacterium]|nr:YidC/Oxa1 family membrane protein insertase [bacterium]